MNKPEEDWRVQKNWLKKRLVGKGFFDTAEMAENNITYSAAYIYNVCRDYNAIDVNDKIPLMQFALIMGMGMDFNSLENNIPYMKDKTNIQSIQRIITDKLASNYKKLLYQDIEKKYLDIVYTLKRIAKEQQKETAEIIEITSADIEKMKDKVEEKKKNYDEIMENKQQLTALLKTVETATQKHLDEIIKYISKSGSLK